MYMEEYLKTLILLHIEFSNSWIIISGVLHSVSTHAAFSL